MQFTANAGVVKKAMRQVWEGAVKKPNGMLSRAFEFKVLNNMFTFVRGRRHGEQAVEVILRTERGESGDKVAVDASLFDAIKTLDDQCDVTFKFLDSNVEVSAESGSKFKFSYGYADAPGCLSEFDVDGTDATFNMSDFIRCAEQTAFAIDTDSAHYALGGVYLALEGVRASFVATCGRRLAHCSVACERGDDAGDKAAIIPASAINALIKIVPRDLERVHVKFGEMKVLFHWDTGKFITVLIDGNFPNWKSILGCVKKESEVQYDAGEIRRTTETLAKIGADSVTITTGKDEMTLENTAKGASIIAPVSVNCVEPITARLDVRFLNEFLGRAKGRVRHFIHEESPNLFEDEDGYQYLIMPLTPER